MNPLWLLLLGLCWVFWPEIRQGMTLCALDAIDWLMPKLEWCMRKHREIEVKLEELERKSKK